MTTNEKLFGILAAIHLCGALTLGVEQPRLASSMPVEAFEASDMRALDIFAKLAEHEHTVIGVSGVLVGSDDLLISVSLSHATVGEVLNAVTAKDPRYAWHDTQDNAIEVTIGQPPLGVTGVAVHNPTLGRLQRYDVVGKLANFIEVKSWLKTHSCSMSEIVAGTPSADVWDLDISSSDEPLRGILNEIGRQTRTYFWSAIEFLENPCSINLSP